MVPKTVLVMYPSHEDTTTVLEVFSESSDIRNAHGFDLNLQCTVKTTKLIWSGSFFRHFVHFLQASHTRRSLLLFDAAFWEWTEVQQSFLMSALAKHRQYKLAADVDVTSVIFVDDHSRVFALAFRSFSVRSEPWEKVYDRITLSLDQFQSSVRVGEADPGCVILEPLSCDAVVKLRVKGSGTSFVDLDIPSVNIVCDIDRIKALVTLVNDFSSTLLSTLSRPVQKSQEMNPPPQAFLRSIAMATSLLRSPVNFISKPTPSAGPASTAVLDLSIDIRIGTLSIISAGFLLQCSSITFCGSLIRWRIELESCHIRNHSANRNGWIIHSRWEIHGSKPCITWSHDAGKANFSIELHHMDVQWTPFTIQSFIDYIRTLCALLSNLRVPFSSTPSSPRKPTPSTSSFSTFSIDFNDCTALFNKRHSHLALLVVPEGHLHYTNDPFLITLRLFQSYIRDMTPSALRARHPTDIIAAERIEVDVDVGDPVAHWSGTAGATCDGSTPPPSTRLAILISYCLSSSEGHCDRLSHRVLPSTNSGVIRLHQQWPLWHNLRLQSRQGKPKQYLFSWIISKISIDLVWSLRKMNGLI